MSDKKGDSGRFRDAFEEKVKSAEQADSQESAPAKAAGSAPGASVSAPEGESILTKQFMFSGPRLADMAIFCRQLSMLLEVGISLVRSLRILAERSQHFLLGSRLHLLPGQDLAGTTVDGVQGDDVVGPKRGDLAGDHRFEPGAGTDLFADRRSDALVGLPTHQAQNLLDSSSRKYRIS